MNALIRVVGALLGFLLGCMILLVIYFVIQLSIELFDIRRLAVRVPIGLVVLPFITAFVGFKVGPALSVVIENYLGGSSPLTRFLFVAPIFWAVVVLAYVQVFEPFGYWISKDEWILVAKIILFAIAVLWAGTLIVVKFIFRQ